LAQHAWLNKFQQQFEKQYIDLQYGFLVVDVGGRLVVAAASSKFLQPLNTSKRLSNGFFILWRMIAHLPVGVPEARSVSTITLHGAFQFIPPKLLVPSMMKL